MESELNHTPTLNILHSPKTKTLHNQITFLQNLRLDFLQFQHERDKKGLFLGGGGKILQLGGGGDRSLPPSFVPTMYDLSSGRDVTIAYYWPWRDGFMRTTSRFLSLHGVFFRSIVEFCLGVSVFP